ncbi:MAG: AAA family ATPase [Bacteroidetes bacterium]|nr:AAA family ATPase [Bacteroidota bacterium]
MEFTFGIPTAKEAKVNGQILRALNEPKTMKENKNFYSAKELYELDIKELPVLIDPIFMKSGIAVFAGSSDTGKSTFLRQLGLAIVKGEDKFLGWDIKAEHKRVVYVSTEDDRNAISFLLNKTLGEGADVECLDRFDYVFDTENLEVKLDEMLTANPADCVIIDALTDLYGGDLNQSNKVRVFLNQYFKLADKHNCLFIFLHHTGKRTEELPPSKNNLLGSQGIEGKARQVIELRRDPSDNNFRHLCIVKGNYLPDGMKEKSFKMKFNSDLTFSMTKERTDFSELTAKTGSQTNYYEDIKPRIVELKDIEGLTFQQIADKLREEGKTIGKSKANQLYNEAKE